MLLNVFRSCGSVGAVLRNLRLNSCLGSAAGVTKKKRNVWFLKMPEMLKSKAPEEIENLKIVPDGYKLIYHSKDVKVIALARFTVFFLLGTCTVIGARTYFKPESVKVREEFFTVKEAVVAFLIQAFVMYIFVTRHVYYVFRNESSYKTVCYGLFGKLQTRIIDHKAKELMTPDPKAIFPFFYYLKGKPVIISLSNFINKAEQSMLIKYQEPKEIK